MDPGQAVRLQNLQALQEAGLLGGEEYAAKRAEIIASLLSWARAFWPAIRRSERRCSGLA